MLSICCHVPLEHAPRFNGAWWLEHGRQFTRTQHCYAFIYFSRVFFSFFSKHSALFFFQLYKDTHFHEALPSGMGKQKCVLSVRGRGGGVLSGAQWSPVRTWNLETWSALARLGKTRSPQSPCRPEACMASPGLSCGPEVYGTMFYSAKISDIFFFFFKPHDDVRDFHLLDSVTSHVQPRRRIKGV